MRGAEIPNPKANVNYSLSCAQRYPVTNVVIGNECARYRMCCGGEGDPSWCGIAGTLLRAKVAARKMRFQFCPGGQFTCFEMGGMRGLGIMGLFGGSGVSWSATETFKCISCMFGVQSPDRKSPKASPSRSRRESGRGRRELRCCAPSCLQIEPGDSSQARRRKMRTKSSP